MARVELCWRTEYSDGVNNEGCRSGRFTLHSLDSSFETFDVHSLRRPTLIAITSAILTPLNYQYGKLQYIQDLDVSYRPFPG